MGTGNAERPEKKYYQDLATPTTGRGLF